MSSTPRTNSVYATTSAIRLDLIMEMEMVANKLGTNNRIKTIMIKMMMMMSTTMKKKIQLRNHPKAKTNTKALKIITRKSLPN